MRISKDVRTGTQDSAYLCVEMLTALSCTRRRTVVFIARTEYARGTANAAAEDTASSSRVIGLQTWRGYIV
jgi:hypothetical protein